MEVLSEVRRYVIESSNGKVYKFRHVRKTNKWHVFVKREDPKTGKKSVTLVTPTNALLTDLFIATVTQNAHERPVEKLNGQNCRISDKPIISKHCRV